MFVNKTAAVVLKCVCEFYYVQAHTQGEDIYIESKHNSYQKKKKKYQCKHANKHAYTLAFNGTSNYRWIITPGG